MTIYFGRGITAESPGKAFTAAYDAAQLKQKQSKLADLLANAYGTQDQAQRQGYITDAIRTDPAQGMTLAKLLQPGTQEAFTLGPGSKRFGPDGRVIAEVPFAPKEPQQPEFDIRQIGNKLYYVPKSPMTGLPSTTPPISDSGNSPAADAGFQTLRDAVMWQESRGNPNAVSPKGAIGTMQTMPGTLRDPGFGVAPAANNSPQEMERVGTDYLRAMTDKYGQIGGLAAYNWGPGNWERALQAAGGDPQRALQMAPRETQQYVPSVLGRVGQGGGAGVGFGIGQQSGLPVGAIPVPGIPDVPASARDAPSGYQWDASGASLTPIPGGPADRKNNPTPADQAKGEMAMRKELTDRIKQDRSVLGMYRNVESAASGGTAASDLSMIFAYMKMLDPGSVVREQEFANAQNATGVPDRIRNLYNQTMKGNRLNPQQRTEFLSEARKLASGAQDRISSVTREYQGIAEQYGYDTARATGMPDFRDAVGSSTSGARQMQSRQPTGQQSGKYNIGQVIQANGKRYRVTGGDMNDPNVEEIR